MVESRPAPKDQPLGIPVYTRPKSQKEPKYSLNEPNSSTMTTAMTNRRRSEPSYPLPPRSQFPLGGSNGAFRPSGFGTNLRKTPQNVDIISSNGMNYSTADLSKNPTTTTKDHNNSERFQSKLKSNTNTLLGQGESQYYPRVTDRADV